MIPLLTNDENLNEILVDWQITAMDEHNE